MKDKTYQIIEYEQITKEKIGEDFFSELEAFLQENQGQFLGYSKRGALQAQNYVGLIQTKSGFILEILPKIAKDNESIIEYITQNANLKQKYENLDKEKQIKEFSKEILLQMLATLKNSPFKHYQKANLKTKNLPLLEIFISMFLEELTRLVKEGIKKEYITKQENAKYLKGKLLIKEHISKNFIHKERFFIEYDEYLLDRIENRIIKTTLKKLYKLSKNSKNQQRIREFLYIFDEVGEIAQVKSAFEKVKGDRTMKHYQDTLLWCKLFLLNESFTPFKGKSIAYALLFDMNLLFESFVGSHFKKKSTRVHLQDSRYYLFDDPKRLRLKPDIVVEDRALLDTKWKIIKDERDIDTSDLYQLFAYVSKYQYNRAYLIYPAIGINRRYSYRVTLCNKPVKIGVFYFDLIEKRLIRGSGHTYRS